MSEGEWLACSDPMQMWGWLVRTDRVSQRRCRCVFVACCELIRQGKLRPQALDVWEESPGVDAHDEPIAEADIERHLFDATGGALYACSEEAELAALLREVFGNLFRPVRFDEAWRTPAALFLARAAEAELPILASRLEPVRLLVLADALEEAGCAEDAILTHLRSAGPHVRGCWVLDLCLDRR
jgi:hypothetical protein